MKLDLARERIEKNQQTRDALLDLSWCGLDALPQEVLSMTWLEELLLQDRHDNFVEGGEANTIANLPDLGGLTRLRELRVGDKLRRRSRLEHQDLHFVSRLAGLEVLSAPSWRVRDLSRLANCKGLLRLELAENSVQDLRPLEALCSLQSLDLADNRIVDLAPLTRLSELSHLDLAGNKIVDVQPLAELASLEHLGLAENQIADLTPLRPWLAGATVFAHPSGRIELLEHKGRALDVSANPLEVPPLQIAASGAEAILSYLDELAETRPEIEDFVNQEAKLLVLGNSTAGKSTLINYLRTRGPKARRRAALRSIPSTHGMVHTVWKPSFHLEKKGRVLDDLTVHLLDFGGQEYYHDCHHLFFTDRTGYVVVWEEPTNTHGTLKTSVQEKDRRTRTRTVERDLEHHPLEYWLDAISYFVWRKSGVDIEAEVENGEDRQEVRERVFRRIGAITVQNKVDRDGRVHLDAAALKKAYPFFIDNVSVSIHRGTRMDHLERNLLAELLERMDLVGETYPGTYPLVMKKLEELGDFRVGVDDVRSVFRRTLEERGLTFEEPRFDNFLTYAQSLGRILYFPESPKLKEHVFVEPLAMLDRFYAVLGREVHDAAGEFDYSLAEAGIRDRIYGRKPPPADKLRAEVESVLHLMERFNLCFLADSKRYFAPQHLPAQPYGGLALIKDIFQRPLYRYQYRGYLHISIILRFLGEYGGFADKRSAISRSSRERLLWKNGIFINKDDTVVLVEFDRQNLQVNLYPQGEPVPNPLIDELAKRLDQVSAGRAYEKQVTLDGEHFVDLALLERNAENKIPWFELDGRSYRLGDYSRFLPVDYKMNKLFISYSHRDLEYVQTLRKHLSVEERKGRIDSWFDREIGSGEEWDGVIRHELEAADIILLLVSPDFLASDYIWDVEVKTAMERHESGLARVIPVILRSCRWQDDNTPFSKLQSPRSEAIDLADNQDQAWTEIVGGIAKVIEDEQAAADD